MSDTSRRVTTLLAVALLGFAAGCTSTSPGEAQPASRPAVADGTEPEPTSEPSSERPREIRLDDVDPCTLLPQGDYDHFYLDEPGQPGTTEDGDPQCYWSGDVGYLDAVVMTREGVTKYEGRLGEFAPTAPIDDFPAYTIVLPDVRSICFVAVDVADDQHLLVQVGLDDERPGLPPVCEYAHQFATSVMSTLVTS